MKIDKVKTLVLEIILLIILVLGLFISSKINNIELAIFMLIFMIITRTILKKRKLLSIYSNQVTWVMTGFAIVYLSLFYLSGLYFGFYDSPVLLSIKAFTKYILPITIIIITSEVIRYIVLSQKSKVAPYILTISLVILDLIMYSKIYDITKLQDFLIVVGFIVFSSISCNLLYNYISIRYGCKSIIIYRIITIIYAYVIPVIPNVYILFRSAARMIYPYLIYLFVEYAFSKKEKDYIIRNKKVRYANSIFMIVVVVILTMLVSCKFKYGILVIGSGSMTGTINKGDAIIFEKYDNSRINKGDVVVFVKNNVRIVHRVVDVKIVNNQYRYFTKGDANVSEDVDYITNSDIVGVLKFKISYIGYPTLWVKDIFS